MDAQANAVKVRHAFNALHNGTAGLAAFPIFIIEVIDDGAWKVVAKPDPSAKPDEFKTFEEWSLAAPPTGLGVESRKKLQDIVKKTVAEVPVRNALKGKSGPKPGDSSRNNVTGTVTGNRRDYTLERLERERPDLLERVEAKELSPNAAAIQAGFRPKTFTVRTDDPEKIAATLRRQLPQDVLNQVINYLEGW